VQGAHVDTPLNDRGKLQATLLGQALIALQQQHRLHDADHDENGLVFLHSAYQRSQETATIAASTYYFNNANYYNYRNNMQELSSIGTIDFGLQEKKKYEMNQIYSSWSLGLIDVKLVDGETCRQVRVFVN
jgi:broad specificity phosphatase PhoE